MACQTSDYTDTAKSMVDYSIKKVDFMRSTMVRKFYNQTHVFCKCVRKILHIKHTISYAKHA